MELRDQLFTGASKRESLYDLRVPNDWNSKLIIFIHGFNGFKDWGCWNLVEKFFVDQHYGFLKYNVSHNGCSTESPEDFVDLEAYGHNTYMKEINDLESILSIVKGQFEVLPEIYLIGHSRGGGIALLQSHQDDILKICSWAGISNIERRFPKGSDLDQWQQDGVRYYHNGRTGQKMPLYFDVFEDFTANRKRLNIEYHCRTSNKPTLVVHGDQDKAVSISEGEEIASWLNTELKIIRNTEHTFGSSHPWDSDQLPQDLKLVCQLTLAFFDEPINFSLLEKESLIADLIKLAKSDSTVRDVEFDFLHTLARQIGITTDDFESLFNKYISYNPPTLEVDRIVQFQRLILLMNVDQESDEKEIAMVRNMGIRMGLNPQATNEVLNVMNDYPEKVIPPKRLIEIFKTFHN